MLFLKCIQWLNEYFLPSILFNVVYVCKFGRHQCSGIYRQLHIISIRWKLSITVPAWAPRANFAPVPEFTDLVPIARGKLTQLKKKISNSATKTKDQTTKYHLEDFLYMFRSASLVRSLNEIEVEALPQKLPKEISKKTNVTISLLHIRVKFFIIFKI